MPYQFYILLTFANDLEDRAQYLRNLPRELKEVSNALQKLIQKGKYELLEKANVSIEQFFDLFQSEKYKDKIAGLHYGGHAQSYELLLQHLDGTKSIAHAEGLHPFLARQKSLRFIFLNGCSTRQHAKALTDLGIPVVIATSEAIKDDIATELSIAFYKALAEDNSLETAWKNATDFIKTKTGAKTENTRGLYREEATLTTDFPWAIYVKDGNEKALQWKPSDEKPPESVVAREAKDLIRKGKTDEAFDKLLRFIKEDADLHNDALLQASRWNELKKQERRGVISSADAGTERNKILYALLEIADEVRKG